MAPSTEFATVLDIGSPAPEFKNILASGSKRVSLTDYSGKFLIMVFYPKDSTPGCTRQLCALRDDYAEMQSLNADVIGVNHGSLNSHNNFAAKQGYPFPILVDEEGFISKAYQAWKPDGGIQRTVYIVGPTGHIIFAQQGMPSDETLAHAIRQA
jgi:thioredoxin-dependent peroxiredoxin